MCRVRPDWDAATGRRHRQQHWSKVSFAHQVLEHGFQVVVVRVDLADGRSVFQRQRRQAGVEGVGAARLHQHGLFALEHRHALDVFPADQLGRQRPVIVADQHDPMRDAGRSGREFPAPGPRPPAGRGAAG